MHNLEELSKLEVELNNAWVKNLLAISIGALTVLLALMPSQPIEAPGKYFLALCWLLLGSSILFSLAASFRPIIEARWKIHALLDISKLPPGQETIPGSNATKRLSILKKVFLAFQVLAVLSFCFAFVSLSVYACLKVLG